MKKKNNIKYQFLREFIDGSFLEKIVAHLRLILFISLLIFAYITNRYVGEKIIWETRMTKKELEELSSKSVSIKTKLMQLHSQTLIKKELEKRNIQLEESTTPVKKIIIEKEEQ